jgi:hypothetical protein
MNFEIYAYWNTTELVNVFNAVAAITGSGDFNGLLRTLALVMILGLVLAVLAGKGRQEDFWRWVVLLAVMHGLLLVPKSNVLIVDRTGTNPTQVVSNVPIGLAALAHGTSKIGDWLTTAFETVFSLPDDVQLRKTGTLFGHRVMLERLGTQFKSPVLVRNLDEFYRECVIPDLAIGQINPDALAETENIWQEFKDVNPGLLVTVADYTDPSATSLMNCSLVYGALTAQINRDADTVLGLKAQGLYPEMTTAFAKAALSNALTNTQQFFAPTASATPVLDQIKQGALCNYLIDAPARVAAQIGDAAQVQQATATAVIAWGLVQGSLQATSSAAGSWMQGSGASGGRFLDNTVRSDQITAGQYNMAPTVRTGAPMRSSMGTDGISTTQSADGTTAVDASGIPQNEPESQSGRPGVLQPGSGYCSEFRKTSRSQGRNGGEGFGRAIGEWRIQSVRNGTRCKPQGKRPF